MTRTASGLVLVIRTASIAAALTLGAYSFAAAHCDTLDGSRPQLPRTRRDMRRIAVGRPPTKSRNLRNTDMTNDHAAIG